MIQAIPVLMICYNRLEYTKQALEALFNSREVKVYIVDNASTDGTVEWLESQPWKIAWHIVYNRENIGIAGAMNQFLHVTKAFPFVGKVDNDTIVPSNWAVDLREIALKYHLDLVQAKHHIIPATHPGGWKGFTDEMPRQAKGVYRNHFVGGSGIIFRRSLVDHIPETSWKLGGWREFQKQHPELRKAFCEDVEIQLLDQHGYSDYPEYYKSTKRL